MDNIVCKQSLSHIYQNIEVFHNFNSAVRFCVNQNVHWIKNVLETINSTFVFHHKMISKFW